MVLLKHTKEELKQWQSLPLSIKELMTKARIREWINEYDYAYLAISGGKDSRVLAHLCDQMGYGKRIIKVFCNTGLEFDSVRKQALISADKVLTPSMNITQCIIKYGYPVISKEVSQIIGECQTAKRLGKEIPKYHLERLLGEKQNKDGSKSQYNIDKYSFLLDAPFLIGSKCCGIFKKNPSKKFENETGLKPIVATMAVESQLRRSRWLEKGCNSYDSKRPICKPISFWTEQDILHYIKKYDLEIADVYGNIIEDKQGTVDGQMSIFDVGIDTNIEDIPLRLTGANRTGCCFCLYGITQDPLRLLRLKDIEPKKYDFVMRGGRFNENGMWIPTLNDAGYENGLGYKFIIDWLNKNGNLNIRY